MSVVLFKFLVRCNKTANELNNFKKLCRYIFTAIICVTYVLRHLACYVGINVPERYISLFDTTDSSVIFSETMIPICKPSSAMPLVTHKTTI